MNKEKSERGKKKKKGQGHLNKKKIRKIFSQGN